MNATGPRYQRGNLVAVKRIGLAVVPAGHTGVSAMRATSLEINVAAINIRDDADEIPLTLGWTSRIAGCFPRACAD
ncbi:MULTISPECIES: hypothetical protein [unclassified Bradyrhizobium]|uniref:hypothetical protein n=1 Tax=unclassified Bradyrhizobium TaxID=2631580 RepID=UPI0014042BDC|nr:MULTISPECIES: hypothetical protein [unclassified Bradyrhizobium]